MSLWYLTIGISLFIIMVGLYTHWIVILIGAVLPFLPMISFLIGRSRDRAESRHVSVTDDDNEKSI